MPLAKTPGGYIKFLFCVPFKIDLLKFGYTKGLGEIKHVCYFSIYSEIFHNVPPIPDNNICTIIARVEMEWAKLEPRLKLGGFIRKVPRVYKVTLKRLKVTH